MTEIEEKRMVLKLIEAGNVLARSLGHSIGLRCPKGSPAVPCTCGSGRMQAQAIQEWQRLIDEIKEA